jgi:hypothetical protein
MKQKIAFYKRYVAAGYSRQQIEELLKQDNSLSDDQRKLIIETLFKKK